MTFHRSDLYEIPIALTILLANAPAVYHAWRQGTIGHGQSAPWFQDHR